MKSYTLLLTISVACLIFSGCGSGEPELGPKPLPDDYEQSIIDWQEHRIDVLTDTTGWLRLVDLIWLEEGDNSFGSGEEQDIQFPEGSIAEHSGTFSLHDGEVSMNVADNVDIRHEGEPVDQLQMVGEGVEERVHATHGDLTWFIDERGDQRGVKVFSMDTPKADRFDGFPRYELKEEWHLKGHFVEYPEETAVEVVNVLGDTIDRSSPGYVTFKVDGELYSIDAFEANSGLFLMFTDHTNRSETYQAGRYMIIDHPDDNGYVTLDFNKAYNPPCAFNPFTTCQLPPPQNRLDLAIPAGEKRPVDFEGV